MRDLIVRRCEPEDYRADHRVYSSPLAIAGTLGVPFSSAREAREVLAREREGSFPLVACAGGEVVGQLMVYPGPRARHSGHFGIAVRDEWRGKGVGTALMEAWLDLADNWLSLSRLDLRVYVEVEGTHRRFAFRDGEYVDAYVMARLR